MPRRAYIRRRKGLLLRVVDGEGFLLDAAQRRIHHLNLIALAVWRLLEEPQTVRGIAAVLMLAFPEADAQDVSRDAKTLVAMLLKEELAERIALQG
jgi:Coenzyme PQQ synthesis protein D (PqqD)